VRTVLLRSLVFSLCASALWATVPLVARDLLHQGPRTYGFLLGAFGLGAVVAALGSAYLRRRHSPDQIATAAAVGYGVASVVIALSPWVALTLLACLLAGSAWVLSYSTFNIAVQVSSPRWVVGRTLAIYQTAAFGGISVGAWLFGEYAEYGGLAASLLTGGLLQAGSFILARRWPLHPSDAIDMDPLSGALDDHARAAIDLEAGPIVVTVEYRVRAEDGVEFLRLAHELGRIRRRDGARRWILMQDLDDPRRWLERFETLTWLDHLRQSQRRTVADQGIRDRVRALHQGPGLPRVHHLLARSPDDAHGALGPERLLTYPEPADPRLTGEVALPPRTPLRESPPPAPGATGRPGRH